MIAFTLFHVAISLLGIAAGFVVIWGLLTSKRLEVWTATFLAAAALTSVTGFLFPIERLTPGLVVGILSLLTLGTAFVARYPKQMIGHWRTTYVVAALISQYFNFAVLIVQSFQKVAPLASLASTPAEPVAQLVALVLFVVLTTVSIIRFRPAPFAERQSSLA